MSTVGPVRSSDPCGTSCGPAGRARGRSTMTRLYGGVVPMYRFQRGLLARGLPRACIPGAGEANASPCRPSLALHSRPSGDGP